MNQLSQSELQSLYDNNTLLQLKEIYGFDLKKIRRILKEKQIRIRTQRENVLFTIHKDMNIVKEIINLTKKESLIDLHYNKNKTIQDIAKLSMMDDENIRQLFKKYKIQNKCLKRNNSIDRAYVYVLLNPIKKGDYNYMNFHFDYEPFYVGIGIDDRIKYHYNTNLNDHNKEKNEFINMLNSLGYEPMYEKILQDIPRVTASGWEKILINRIGRLCDKTGSLYNKTKGGESIGNSCLPIHQYELIEDYKLKYVQTFQTISDAQAKNDIGKIYGNKSDYMINGFVFIRDQNYYEYFDSNNTLEDKERSIEIYNNQKKHKNDKIIIYDKSGCYVEILSRFKDLNEKYDLAIFVYKNSKNSLHKSKSHFYIFLSELEDKENYQNNLFSYHGFLYNPNKINENNKKLILRVDPNSGEILETIKGITEAKKLYSGISNCLKNKFSLSNGFIFIYENEKSKLIEYLENYRKKLLLNKNRKNSKSVYIVENGNKIEFSSVKELSLHLNCPVASLLFAIKIKNGYYKKLDVKIFMD